LKGIPCKVNLIPYNPIPDAPFERPPDERVLKFQEVLLSRNYTATLRDSKGRDIGAACGQLRASA
ncbi:MAG: 23S rRNA (adenine(2503)-C(2))-methyltransferase RlmN, partial [Candidatus Latescibacterota bacterium]